MVDFIKRGSINTVDISCETTHQTEIRDLKSMTRQLERQRVQNDEKFKTLDVIWFKWLMANFYGSLKVPMLVIMCNSRLDL